MLKPERKTFTRNQGTVSDTTIKALQAIQHLWEPHMSLNDAMKAAGHPEPKVREIRRRQVDVRPRRTHVSDSIFGN